MSEVNILFDGPPGPVAGRFVETEDGLGRGISFGEWVKPAPDDPSGYWRLRFDDRSDEVARLRARVEELDGIRVDAVRDAASLRNRLATAERELAEERRVNVELCDKHNFQLQRAVKAETDLATVRASRERAVEALRRIREAAEAYQSNPVNALDRPESWNRLDALVRAALDGAAGGGA